MIKYTVLPFLGFLSFSAIIPLLSGFPILAVIELALPTILILGKLALHIAFMMITPLLLIELILLIASLFDSIFGELRDNESSGEEEYEKERNTHRCRTLCEVDDSFTLRKIFGNSTEDKTIKYNESEK